MLFCAMGLIWGIPYLLIRIAVRDFSPPALVCARTAPAALVLLPLAAHRRQLRPLLERWRWIVAFALVEMAVPWLLLSRAEQHVTSATAGLLIATVPLIAAVLYPRTTRTEPLGRRRLLGLLVGFGGVAALVGLDLAGTDLAAIAEIGVVAVCYAIGPLVVDRRLGDLPSLGVVSVSLGLTAVLYAPVAATHWPSHVSAEAAAAVAGLAFVCSALAFVLFFALIAEVGPSRATVITYVNPAVAVVAGVVVLGEPFTAGLAVGLPLILTGSVLSTGRAPATEPGEPITR